MHHRAARPNLRVLHVAPEVAALDVYVDDVLAIRGIAYGQLTGYGGLSRGDHRLTIVPAGGGPGSRQGFYADIEDLEAELNTLVVTQPRHRLRATLLDDTTHAPAPAHAKVRLMHAAPDMPALEVTLRDGKVLSATMRLGEATPFAEMPAGVVDLELHSQGHVRPDLLFPRYTLLAGNLYTFVAAGLYRGVPELAIMPLVEEVRLREPVGLPQ